MEGLKMVEEKELEVVVDEHFDEEGQPMQGEGAPVEEAPVEDTIDEDAQIEVEEPVEDEVVAELVVEPPAPPPPPPPPEPVKINKTLPRNALDVSKISELRFAHPGGTVTFYLEDQGRGRFLLRPWHHPGV